MIPCNGPVIEIVDPHVQQDVEDKCEIEQRKVETIHLFTNPVLNTNFNTEKPERFNQQVKEDQQGKVGDKSLFQTGYNLGRSMG